MFIGRLGLALVGARLGSEGTYIKEYVPEKMHSSDEWEWKMVNCKFLCAPI